MRVIYADNFDVLRNNSFNVFTWITNNIRSLILHVHYQEHEAGFDINTGEILDGEIPKNKLRLVQAWIELHRDELIANWELAVSGRNTYSIEPLK